MYLDKNISKHDVVQQPNNSHFRGAKRRTPPMVEAVAGVAVLSIFRIFVEVRCLR
jgi:hypothetical protein